MSARLALGLLTLSLPLPACAKGEAAPAIAADRAAWAEACEDWDEWDKDGPPFRIHGNTYYVGTCGIAAILVTGERGHVLIDSGTEAGAEVVLANIGRLGFDPGDIGALLTSHEHFDHVGGMARIKPETSAAYVFVHEAAENVFATGEPDARDPQFGVLDPMAPVTGTLAFGGNADGRGEIDVRGLPFTVIETPGHTPGALSWQWRSCEGADCRWIVYADSLSPVSADGYRFSDHPAYVADYRAGIERLANLDCDILITPHPSASNMRPRLTGEAEWSDSAACKAYAASIARRLDTRLAEEDAAR